MPEFLQLTSVGNALKKFLQAIPTVHPPVEDIQTILSLGRVTAVEIHSDEILPAFPRSTVDGYAVRAEDTYGASESIPAYLKLISEVKMGNPPEFEVHSGECALIHTGGMLPQGCNSVVLVEQTQVSRAGEVEIHKSVAADENTILAGEDVKKGEMILPIGSLLRTQEIGGLLALGLTQVKVVRKPRIGILSSGDELVQPNAKLPLARVRDINGSMLSSFVILFGGEPVDFGIALDDEQTLTQKIAEAYRDCDSVIITAGSSVSTRDLTAKVISKMGKPGVVVHGINIKPGKPTILAVCDGKPLIGLPGNPVSAFVVARLFVKPMIARLLGLARAVHEPVVNGVMGANFASTAGRRDYVPVILTEEKGKIIAEPIHFKSNLIFSLVKADGLAIIPEDVNGLVSGDVVKILLI